MIETPAPIADTVARFSNRVANYVKYRPGYPAEVSGLFRDEMGLRPESVVADIGSGPGISARLFIENGNTVYCVEPNAAMRAAAEEIFSGIDGFDSVDGTAENTTLGDRSVDYVVAAQAFHWFEPTRTMAEFNRILRPRGFVALMWNERQTDSTAFLRGYENILLRFATDYAAVRHDNITDGQLAAFFQKEFERRTFENVQVFDYQGLLGRLLSSSYMPAKDDPRFSAMDAELRTLFAKHAEGDRIKVFYDTNIFFTQI